MPDDLFLERYKGLNTGQKKAVDTVEGPVMVIAGPGTGKTTVLTLRIAQILRKTDTPPDGILALTFTESAVASMRKKLVELIGPAAYRVGLFTFHGFAEEMIRRFPEYFPRIIGGSVATEAEKLSILEHILDTESFESIRPFGSVYYYVRGALHTISDLKRDAVTPARFAAVLSEEEQSILSKEDLKHTKGRYVGEMKGEYKDALKNIQKNRELMRLYEIYESRLKEEQLYDFDDMLLELLRAFKEHPDLLQSVQETYLYFLADEHQDANNAQNGILELLSSYFDEPNLFIVGDEKQAIYRFQGASIENFLYFKNKFPTATLIYLDENYRSGQAILDASHALAESLPGDKALRPRLMAKGGIDTEVIEAVAYQSEADEALGVVDDIRREIQGGAAPEDIAVLVRTNREIAELGRFLIASGVPTTLFQDDDVLSDPNVARLLLLLRAVNDPSDKLLAEALFIDFLDLDPADIIKLLEDVRGEKISVLEASKRFEGFYKNLSEWIMLARNRGALEVVTKILATSGFTERLLREEDAVEEMALLSAFYSEIASRQAHKKDLTLAGFLSDIDTLIEHGSRLSFASRIPKEHTVSVMTAHRSKGMEWNSVYIPHAVSGNWGSKRSMLQFRLPFPLGNAHQSGKEEDERRLFYVALTRAKAHIVVSYSRLSSEGKELVKSQFVEEMPPQFVKVREGLKAASPAALLGALAAKVSGERTLWDQDYLREVFFKQGLSATAVNNYIECPWKYFFKNLICVPDTLGKQQLFGTALHAALADMTNALRLGKGFELDDLIASFTKALSKQPLDHGDYEESLGKGKEVLAALWSSERPHWHTEALAEFNISGVHLVLPDGEDLRLRGRLDKVDLLNGASRDRGGPVCVVDFKTGRVKTRNDLLGETKSSTGNEKRQLDFYRLLLDLFDGGKFTMTNGTILFTEPDEKGKIKKETFDISVEDSERIKAETIRIAEEIRNFTFWDSTCNDKDCEYCKLRKVLIS